MKDQTSQEFHRSALSINLWWISHLENIDDWPNFSRGSSKMYSMWTFEKILTHGKYRWKSKLLKGFIKNVLSVDLWKIPRLENIDERSNFSKFHRKCTKYWPLKNSTLRKYRCMTKLLRGFIQMYYVWTSGKVHIQNTSMKVRTSQKFHQVWIESGPLEDSTLKKYGWKIKLLKSFIEVYQV